MLQSSMLTIEPCCGSGSGSSTTSSTTSSTSATKSTSTGGRSSSALQCPSRYDV